MDEYASIMRDFVNTLSGVEQQRFARFDSFSDAMKDPLLSAKADIFYYSDDIANQMHDGAIRAKNERVLSFLDPANAESQVKSIVNDINAKSTKPPEFKMPESPQLKPFKPSEFTPSTEFSDSSAGFSQHEAVSQEEKDRVKDKATRTRILSGREKQIEAASSSGFLSWSRQQDEAEKIRQVEEKSRREAEEIERNMKDKNLVNVRKSASEVEEESKRQAREIEDNMKWRRESKNGIGPDNDKGYVSSAVGGTSRSWRKNHTNEENRFIDAKRYYSKNPDIIAKQKSKIENAKTSFIDSYGDESMISDESMGKMKAAFEQAKSEHSQSILESRRAGRSAHKFDEGTVNSQIAQKVFGKAEDAELAAVDYMRKKNNAEGIIARAENRNSVLNKYIDPALEKGENKIARGAKASVKGGLGWKGKAAIFGGVALGALSLVGVANMAMSGGRQSNSNLYNPYQAMY